MLSARVVLTFQRPGHSSGRGSMALCLCWSCCGAPSSHSRSCSGAACVASSPPFARAQRRPPACSLTLSLSLPAAADDAYERPRDWRAAREAIGRHLDSVDKEDALLRWDEAEVDRVRNRPDAPRAGDLIEALRLDLVEDVRGALHLERARIAEEEHRKARVPKQLVNRHLERDGTRVRLGADPMVEGSIECVRARSMHEETKRGAEERHWNLRRGRSTNN